MSKTYPSFKVAGNALELGRQHGVQAGEQIRTYLDYLLSSLKLSRADLKQRALRFLPLFEEHSPHLVDEINGLAEGAKIDPAEALALQLRGELGQIPAEGCTTYVISGRGTAKGEPLIGQTSDTPAEIEACAYVLHLQPDDRPEILMWTFGGMLGYHGINRHGVSHFANSLGGGPAWKFAISHYPIKRMMLEQKSVGDVVQLLREIPVCSNGNYVLADGAGQILDVELTSEGVHLLEDAGEGFIAHSNHYLCAPFACEANFKESLPDSFPRLNRIQQLIRLKFGTITVDDVKNFLRDHSGYPVSICRHPHKGHGVDMLPASGKTVCALIAEPAHGRLHVAKGNPCDNPFVMHTL